MSSRKSGVNKQRASQTTRSKKRAAHTADAGITNKVSDSANNVASDVAPANAISETPLEFAAKHVAAACAAASNLVRVISFEPLTTAPAQLFLLSFKAVGIITSEQIALFRAHLIQFMPAKFAPLLQDNQLPLGPDTNIGGIVHYIEVAVFKLGF
jgi:hypothetical protein